MDYDAIIIGSGQGGGPLSTALAGAGRRTALIEREHVGGTCINEGCTPTKTMVASGRVAYLSRRGADYGVRNGAVSVDMSVVRQRKRDIVKSFREGSANSIVAGKVDLIMGDAAFTGPRSIRVQVQDGSVCELSAGQIFIDTGARPAEPPLDGLKSVPFLNSTTVMELDEIPDHLLVLGGGYVGLEFAQMFRRFGSAVSIVQQGKQLLAREDADVALAVAGVLTEDGIDVLLDSTAQRVGLGENGSVHLAVKTPDGERTLHGSHLLIAAGRSPNTETLNLDAAGVETDERGFIKVDERLETNVAGIYAMGDVAGSPAFTHISYDDFRILRANLLTNGEGTEPAGRTSTIGRMVPYTVFIDPQLGRVGLTETEAREQGRSIKVASMPMSHVARALETAESRGLIKVVVDQHSRQILGCAVLGLEGGEIMAMIEIAMMGKLPYTALRDGIFAHPTLAEAFNNLFGSL